MESHALMSQEEKQGRSGSQEVPGDRVAREPLRPQSREGMCHINVGEECSRNKIKQVQRPQSRNEPGQSMKNKLPYGYDRVSEVMG
jgi:hypothetical protein